MKTSATSPDSGIQTAVPASGKRQEGRARKRPDIQTKGRDSSGISTEAGTLPGPPRSRPGSPDRHTGPGSAGPAAGPVPPLAGGSPSPARLTRPRRRRREPRTDKGQRTDGRARWRRALPECATRAQARGPRLGTGRAPRVPLARYRGGNRGTPGSAPLAPARPRTSGASFSSPEVSHLFAMDPAQRVTPDRPRELIRACDGACLPRPPPPTAHRGVSCRPGSPESRVPCKAKMHGFRINLDPPRALRTRAPAEGRTAPPQGFGATSPRGPPSAAAGSAGPLGTPAGPAYPGAAVPGPGPG